VPRASASAIDGRAVAGAAGGRGAWPAKFINAALTLSGALAGRGGCFGGFAMKEMISIFTPARAHAAGQPVRARL
jgi:hypothetical protein